MSTKCSIIIFKGWNMNFFMKFRLSSLQVRYHSISDGALSWRRKYFAWDHIFWHETTLCEKNCGLFHPLNPRKLNCECTSSRMLNDLTNSWALLAMVGINFNLEHCKVLSWEKYGKSDDGIPPKGVWNLNCVWQKECTCFSVPNISNWLWQIR